jgi:hypothetical protein
LREFSSKYYLIPSILRIFFSRFSPYDLHYSHHFLQIFFPFEIPEKT